MGALTGKYKKGVIIAMAVLITGLLLDAFLPPLARILPAFPGNLMLVLLLLLVIILAGFFIRRHRIYHFLSSGFAAVPAISVFTFLIIFMGIIPQQNTEQAAFLNNIKASWSFYFAGIFLLVILLYSTARRMKQFNRRNVSFVLNHIGIAVILLAGGAGQTDHKQYSMTLRQGEPVWYAFDEKGTMHELDFALEMQTFNLEYHNPLLKITTPEGKTLSLVEISKASEGKKIVYKQYSLLIEKFIPEASKSGDKYVEFHSMASVSALCFHLLKDNDTVRKSVWVGSGSHMFPEKTIQTETGMIIRLNPPMPKQYTTIARLYKKDGTAENLSLSVNDPAEINGWKLYQQSYDESKGKYSDVSILSLVKDPWLPAIYFGIFMLLAGVVTLFITGKPKKSQHE
ncbi:MAG: cytochrome c biogenesis protein ResB [Bacteroidales bacterium]